MIGYCNKQVSTFIKTQAKVHWLKYLTNDQFKNLITINFKGFQKISYLGSFPYKNFYLQLFFFLLPFVKHQAVTHQQRSRAADFTGYSNYMYRLENVQDKHKVKMWHFLSRVGAAWQAANCASLPCCLARPARNRHRSRLGRLCRHCRAHRRGCCHSEEILGRHHDPCELKIDVYDRLETWQGNVADGQLALGQTKPLPDPFLSVKFL